MYKPTKKRVRFQIWECHVTMTKKDAYINNEIQLQNQSLTFIHKNNHFFQLPAFSLNPMAYNTTVSLNKVSCANYVDFGKFQDKFGRLSRSKNDSNYLDEKLKLFKEDDNKEFRLVQNLTMEEADFNKFLRMRNQLVKAAENFARE